MYVLRIFHPDEIDEDPRGIWDVAEVTLAPHLPLKRMDTHLQCMVQIPLEVCMREESR